MNKYAVLVAGGNGSRMGSSLPKQFLHLNNKPIIIHTLNAFKEAFKDIEIFLVLPATYMDYTREILEQNNFIHPVNFIVGGETRFHSVQNGLTQIKEEGIVFVHDAVRCMVTPDLIRRCYNQAVEQGSAIPVIPMKDSVRAMEDKEHHHPVDRTSLCLVQTPQTYRSQILLPSFDRDFNVSFTDEATVVESAGHQVYLIEGEDTNIKITSPVDLLIAEAYLDKRNK